MVFEHQQQIFKLMNKKIILILRQIFALSGPIWNACVGFKFPCESMWKDKFISFWSFFLVIIILLRLQHRILALNVYSEICL